MTIQNGWLRAVLVLAGASLPSGAFAFMAADLEAAKDVVAVNCSMCHAVTDFDTPAESDAPAFDTIARDSKRSSLSFLRKALKAPHWPEDAYPALGGSDIDNLIGFIRAQGKE